MRVTDETEMVRLIDDACRRYRGQSDVLASAIGTLFIARMYGWKVAKMVVSESTCRKYEEILGVQFQDVAEERGELANKSLGLAIADKVGDYWAIVQGRVRDVTKFDRRALVP